MIMIIKFSLIIATILYIYRLAKSKQKTQVTEHKRIDNYKRDSRGRFLAEAAPTYSELRHQLGLTS